MYAHSLKDQPQSQWQPLEEHLNAVAELAGDFAEDFGARRAGELLGRLHDLGKARQGFQNYLVKASQGKGRRGEEPHAVYGARYIFERGNIPGKLLAYCVAGHHGGLPNWIKDLEHRLNDAKPLDEVLSWAPPVETRVDLPLGGLAKNEVGFAFSFLGRMLFSCLTDADWLDTERFMDPDKARWREGGPNLAELAERFSSKLQRLNDEARESPVNRIRRQVQDECLRAAELPPGLFSLTVPTGGGKTLSSMAFALKHARRHGLRRIIYVIPYTSIIEQNAKVFRKYLFEDAVVEHHSSVDIKDDKDDENPNPKQRRAQLAAENWDAPLVVTTSVQFFESLFANKPSRCRKLHNLARSVIILDEAQMLPQPLLLPCLRAIRELALRYGATVVLCTATQPAVGQREEFPQGLDGVREIVSNVPALHQALRRVQVEDLGALDDEALCERLAGHQQALCVVNTRRHARELFQRLRGREGLFHLSGNMTGEHRARVIDTIKPLLKADRPCLVISTSLIECGVDADFPVVYRALAGLDSVAQAAGRCDREGRLTAAAGHPAGRVYIFEPTEAFAPAYLEQPVNALKQTLLLKPADPLAPEVMEGFFSHLFWRVGAGELDKKRILEQLEEGAGKLSLPFRTVGSVFQVIENTMKPLIIRENDKVDVLVRKLEFAPAPGRALRCLQRHIVQISFRAWDALVRSGNARELLEGVAVLEKTVLYDKEVGLLEEADWDQADLSV